MSWRSMSSKNGFCTNKCRACMKEGGKMLPMYDDNTISKINLPYKLAQLTSIQIDRFDGLPTMLCPKCAYRTNVLYSFKLEVQESDKKFRMIRETQLCTVKKEEFSEEDKNNSAQADESLDMLSNVNSIHNADDFEDLSDKPIDEIKDNQQYETNISQLVESGRDNKETSHLNNLFYNIIQETDEGQMDVQLVKTEIPEEISKMLAMQNVAIMYISKSAINSMENTLTLDEQEEIENCNNAYISEVENLNGQENEEALRFPINSEISDPVESNVTTKSKCAYWEHQDITAVMSIDKQEQYDDTVQDEDKETKVTETISNVEQSVKIENSDGSDSDYFDDGRDNILGSVSDAIIRIKEVQQENGIEYQCTLCLQNYDQLTNILLHTVDNHVPLSGPFFCMVCEKDCKSHRELRAHVKTHTGEFPYSCFLCEKAYTKKRYLKRHMACHPNFSRHRCLKCGCRFKSKSDLETHAMTHEHVAPYACNQCTRVFNHKGNYKRHLISHLDPQGLHLPKYPCSYCGKRFPNNRTLQTHIRVHTGEKPFQCDVCHKSFSQRGNLLNHAKIHSNPRSYTCEVCGKSFNQRATLRDHTLLHTGEKPHVCNVCGKAFTVSAALRRHMFNHGEGKPFKCENCDMGFVGKYDLRRHMRVHENRPTERRRKNAKTVNFLQPKSEEDHVALNEEPNAETMIIEVEREEEEEEGQHITQNITQAMPQVESEKENEDALFNLQSYPVLYTTVESGS